uniref:Immunoglobulin V-set domain-containing protein n=1 Tax=Sarcophilus harrisii TaxID=9305 RepID=A0A7N4NWZ1_SARHA
MQGLNSDFSDSKASYVTRTWDMTVMYWYRQDSGSGLQLISFSLNIGFTETEVPYGYSASRTEKSFFLLTLKSTIINQTSAYFCASTA